MNSTTDNLNEASVVLSAEEMLESKYLHNGYTIARKKRGDMIGHFCVEECLGSGGMGEVYRCSNQFLGKMFAVKVLDFSSDKKKKLERFIREARLLFALDHPNIVTFYDAFCDKENKQAYLVMEYIEGRSIADILKDGPMAEAEVIRVIQEVCNALTTAHKKGVVHRDIKPDNILIAKDGTVKLIDLGIAKIVEDASAAELTLENTIIGSPLYASPEQCRNSKEVDYRSDLFSIGSTMYHMLAGKRPFDGDSIPDIISNVIHQDPIPIVILRHDLSPIMLKLIQELMQKDPERRMLHAETLNEQLENARSCQFLFFYYLRIRLFRPFRVFLAYFQYCPVNFG